MRYRVIRLPNLACRGFVVKHVFIATGLCSILFISHTLPCFSAESYTVKYGESLPKGLETELLLFESGPHGEKSKACLEYEAQKRERELYLLRTPKFTSGKITYLGHEPIPDLPGRDIWKFRISGIKAEKPNTLLSFSFEKPPAQAALPIGIAGLDSKVESFDPALIKDSALASTLPDGVKITDGNISFEKKLTETADSMDISFVATSKPSDFLINVKAEIPGYQPIKAMLPSPNMD